MAKIIKVIFNIYNNSYLMNSKKFITVYLFYLIYLAGIVLTFMSDYRFKLLGLALLVVDLIILGLFSTGSEATFAIYVFVTIFIIFIQLIYLLQTEHYRGLLYPDGICLTDNKMFGNLINGECYPADGNTNFSKKYPIKDINKNLLPDKKMIININDLPSLNKDLQKIENEEKIKEERANNNIVTECLPITADLRGHCRWQSNNKLILRDTIACEKPGLVKLVCGSVLAQN